MHSLLKLWTEHYLTRLDINVSCQPYFHSFIPVLRSSLLSLCLSSSLQLITIGRTSAREMCVRMDVANTPEDQLESDEEAVQISLKRVCWTGQKLLPQSLVLRQAVWIISLPHRDVSTLPLWTLNIIHKLWGCRPKLSSHKIWEWLNKFTSWSVVYNRFKGLHLQPLRLAPKWL